MCKHTVRMASCYMNSIDFPNPSVQTPSLVTLVGGARKTRAVRQLLSPTQCRCVYPPTMTHQQPVVLADYTFPGPIPTATRFFGDPYQSMQEFPPGTVAESVLARLLVPFTLQKTLLSPLRLMQT